MIRRRHLGPIAALVTLAVLGGAGGATAAWVASASVSASTSSATVTTTLAQTGALTTTYRYAGSRSAAGVGELTITNAGGAPLSYALANRVTGSTTLAQKTTLRLWTGTCGATAPVGAVVTTFADTAPALPAAARTLAAGASVRVCVSTQIEGATNAELQGQSATATLSVTGAVGAHWTTSATAASITQTAYRLAAAGTPTCLREGGRDIRLTWSAPAHRTDTAAISYRLYDVASGATVATVTSADATVSAVLSGTAIAQNGTYSLAVEATETSASGTTASASAPVEVTRTTNPSESAQSGPRYHCA